MPTLAGTWTPCLPPRRVLRSRPAPPSTTQFAPENPMRRLATKNQPAPTGVVTTAWVPWVILGIICALVIGFFAWSAKPGWLGMRASRADDAYYNLLVRGFRAGQLDLKTEVPPGLAHLADPYDPIANAGYLLVDGHPLWDLSYYHGK